MYLGGLLMLVLGSINTGSGSSFSLILGVVSCHVAMLLLYSGVFSKFALLFLPLTIAFC